MYLVYGLGKLRLTDYNVSNKFVKRVAFIRALNCLYKYYLKIYMVECEDGLMNYFLYRTVKSFYFLKRIGYYYIYNKKTNKERQTRILKKLKFQFLYLKIVFEFTKKTLLEKNICNAILNFIEYYNKQINFSLKNKKDFQFYNDIINTYLNSSFINANNKNYLSKIRNVINNKIKNII
jgi:hypothetical protein